MVVIGAAAAGVLVAVVAVLVTAAVIVVVRYTEHKDYSKSPCRITVNFGRKVPIQV